MDVDDIIMVDEDKEIHEAYKRISNNVGLEQNPDDYKVFLSYASSNSVAVKKLSIQGIFRFFTSFDEAKLETVNKLLELLADPDSDIRKFVASRITVLCKEGCYVGPVCDALTQMLYLHPMDQKELDIAEKSLGALITHHPQLALPAIHTSIVQTESIKNRMTAIQFMYQQVNKMGQWGDGMKEKMTVVFVKMLKEAKDYKEGALILAHAKESKLFTTVADRANLVDAIDFDMTTIRPNLPAETLKKNQENLCYALHCAEYVGVPTTLGENAVNFVLENACNLMLIPPPYRNSMLRVVADFTSRDRRYKTLPKKLAIDHYFNLFLYLMSTLPALPDDEDADKLLDEVVELYELEALLLVLHNLVDNVEDKSKLVEMRRAHVSNANYLLMLVKESTQQWKKALDEKLEFDTELLDGKTIEDIEERLLVGNNIGVMLLDFLLPIPHKTFRVHASWDNIKKTPEPLRKRKTENVDDLDPSPKKQKPKRPSNRARRDNWARKIAARRLS